MKLHEQKMLAGLVPRSWSLAEARERRVFVEAQDPDEAAILAWCGESKGNPSHKRGGGMKTKGYWGMRSDVMIDGYKGKDEAACAIIDLQRSKPHPKMTGMSIPVVLARGKSWKEVRHALEKAGEIPASDDK